MLVVDQDGYFYGISGIQGTEEDFIYISYAEGGNARGEVIYRDGMSAEGNYYNDGILNGTEGKKE